MERSKYLVLYTDGASLGNPGPAGLGVVIKDGKGRILKRICRHVGTKTNNEAEYMALIVALKEALKMGARCVEVFTDSQLLERQISGKYRVKSPHLKFLHREVRALCSQLERFVVTHVPREENKEADSLARKAARSRY